MPNALRATTSIRPRFANFAASRGVISTTRWQLSSLASCGPLEEALTEEAGKTKRLSRTRQKLKRAGVRQALTDLALKPQPSVGFLKLIEFGMADMFAEPLILKYRTEFEPEVISAARERSGKYGVGTGATA
jgi:hypothetical protein